jgi:SWI/SNF-related matrix-associated actin-dependent regulator of chromatin subfamily A-like protein 1
MKTITKAAVMVTFQNSGKSGIKITFPFNRDDLDHVKTLPGRRFHGDSWPKFWTCPLSVEAIEALKWWDFTLDDKLEDFLNKKKTSVNEVQELEEIPGLKMELFPFQKKGVSFIEAKDGRALLADSMGLGKTCQSLVWLQLHSEKRPVIIVVPASLKLNWEREIKMWMNPIPNIQILFGTKPNQIIGDIIIINYDILPAWLEKLQEIKASVLILDEIHYLKNSKAKRTKAGKALGKNIPHILGLSGTPIVNRPIEAFNALKLIDDTVVPSFWKYAQRYCGARHNGFGWDFSGASHTEELHQKLVQTVMLRRLKKDVLSNLPEKIYSYLPMELDNRKEYITAENNFIQWVKENRGEEAAQKASNAEAFAQIEALKQLSIKGKMKQAIDWVKDFIEVDGKLVVFATHKSTIDSLMAEFKDIAVKIDGSVTGIDRDKAVQEFQNNNKIRLFIGNIKAAGVGISLTASSSVAFLELPWSPGDAEQASDRVHRIGQKDSVTVYYLLAQNSIEEKIAKMLDRKKKVLDSILDGKETEQESLLSELIKSYSYKEGMK